MEIYKKILIQNLDKYEISNLGKIRNIKTKKVIKTWYTPKDREYVRFSIKDGDKSYTVHRLLMLTFKPEGNIDNKVINHIDNDPRNNTLENLEWCTQSENMQRTIRNKDIRKNRLRKIFESKNWDSAKDFYEELLRTKHI